MTSWDYSQPPYLHPRWDDEVELEKGMLATGADTFRLAQQTAQKKGDMSHLPAQRKLTGQWIEPIAKGLVEWIASRTNKRGPRPIALPLLQMLHPEKIAFITLRSVFMGLSIQRTHLLSLASKIGSAIEHEAKTDLWIKEDPDLWRTVKHFMDKRGSTASHRKRVNQFYFNRDIKDQVQWRSWSDEEIRRVGLQCIDILVRYTKRFSMVNDPMATRKVGLKSKKLRPALVLEADQEVLSWINEQNQRQEVLRPYFQPMLMPPLQWETPRSGGYYTPFVKTPFMIRFKASHENQRQKAIDDLEAVDMPEVYEAINTIQAVPWKVNKKVYEVVKRCWDLELTLGGLPRRSKESLPFKAEDISEEDLRLWKRAASEVHTRNSKMMSSVVSVKSIIKTADRFVDETFYFPHILDFRGRMYPIPSDLQPQGTDLAKGLLTFEEPKAVTSDDAGWLAIQLANTFGEDDTSLEDRIEWVEARSSMWRSIAADPMEDRRWADADDPWQTLAAIFEWVRWLDEGEGMMSSLPVRIDGTCNGIQHLSALLRDEKGGAAVNLTPSPSPRDIYLDVAKSLTKRISEIDDEGRIEADKWLALCDAQIQRTLTKRPVMILPYGGTQHAFFEYTMEWLTENDPKGVYIPEEERGKAVKFLVKELWVVVCETVDAAIKLMKWFQDCARVASKGGLPLFWETPCGFIVRHFYGGHNERQIITNIDGRTINIKAQEISDKLDARAQAKGIAPNFIHSIDASCLMSTVALAKAHGVGPMTVIHDAYGARAGDMWTLRSSLQAAFIETHEQPILEMFRQSCLEVTPPKERKNMPEIPPMGSLNLELVRDSDFFFS